MKIINISERKENRRAIVYLLGCLCDNVGNKYVKVEEHASEKRIYLTIECPKECFFDVKKEVEDKIADIITINYKSKYLRENLKVKGLDAVQKEFLFCALISADLDDDKEYVKNRIRNMTDFAIDGIMNFYLKPLKDKWKEVASYIPQYFFKQELVQFVNFMLEDKEYKKAIIVKNKVYDNTFQRLFKSVLLEENEHCVGLVNELILYGCNEIEIDSSIDKKEEVYLKEYFKDKINFHI